MLLGECVNNFGSGRLMWNVLDIISYLRKKPSFHAYRHTGILDELDETVVFHIAQDFVTIVPQPQKFFYS